jgi:hypothetical protein
VWSADIHTSLQTLRVHRDRSGMCRRPSIPSALTGSRAWIRSEPSIPGVGSSREALRVTLSAICGYSGRTSITPGRSGCAIGAVSETGENPTEEPVERPSAIDSPIYSSIVSNRWGLPKPDHQPADGVGPVVKVYPIHAYRILPMTTSGMGLVVLEGCVRQSGN